MKYAVIISRDVENAVADQVVYFREHEVSDNRIEGWLGKLWNLIGSLSRMPLRFPVASAESARYGKEVRRVNHGEYAVYYRVDDAEHTVYVVAFRHGKRRRWLEEDEDDF